jgi:NADPH:quinone reductase-like Zn-dependent oxidoreductase
VEKSGPGASKFQPGQRVVAAGWAAGTWQDYVVQPEKSLVGTADGTHATHSVQHAAATAWHLSITTAV